MGEEDFSTEVDDDAEVVVVDEEEDDATTGSHFRSPNAPRQ